MNNRRGSRSGAMHRWGVCLATLVGLCVSPGAAASPDARQLKDALANVCRQADPVLAVGAALGGVIELRHTPLSAPVGVAAVRHRLLLPDGSRIRLDLHRAGKSLRQVIIEVFARIPRPDRDPGRNAYRPIWWLVADGGCRVVAARKLNYSPQGAADSVDVLKTNLRERQLRLQLNPPIPAPDAAPPGTDAVPVAMIDSGVNYLLPQINQRLARDAAGRILGFDYWDLDPRPFDSNPARSAFVPQRHGTRTASIMLSEAPVASLVPYRYPRPAMARMGELVEDAAGKGVVIVNLSLGSRKAREWRAFEEAARAHPEMLFIASAGNNGWNIDERPVYPAALDLGNLLTVSSADGTGLPARGSNWGPESVDLLIPAERLIATDYRGGPRYVSGSSHAAARLSALAACLLAAHPGWRAPELKKAIFAMAQAPVNRNVAYVKIGLLAAPPGIDRGACRAQPSALMRLGHLNLTPESIQAQAPKAGSFRYRLKPLTLVWIRGAGWRVEELLGAVSAAANILAQCAVAIGPVAVEMIAVPRRLRFYETATALELMRALKPQAPSAWFVKDTLMRIAFEAETIGHANSANRSALTDSLWLTRLLSRPGLALAHELYHLLSDSGRHTQLAGNLMNDSTSAANTRLEDWQCERMIRVGTAFGNLRPYP